MKKYTIFARPDFKSTTKVEKCKVVATTKKEALFIASDFYHNEILSTTPLIWDHKNKVVEIDLLEVLEIDYTNELELI